MKKFLEGLKPTLHISHRGGAKLAPENTMVAFEQAVRTYRTDMLELDVHLTSDGEVVVAHDDDVSRCTNGEGLIRELPLAKLQAFDAGYRFTPDGGKTFPFRGQGVRIPTLRELFRALPGVRMNIEAKEDQPELERAFVELIRAENAVNRVCIGSELDVVAERIHALLPEACHFYPRSAGAEFVLSLRSGEPPPQNDRFTVLALPYEFEGVWIVDPPLVEAARQLGKWLSVWTVDDPEAMKRLVELGVGGIMTDRPDVLRTVLTRSA